MRFIHLDEFYFVHIPFNIIIIIIYSLEFFKSMSADGLSLEFKR